MISKNEAKSLNECNHCRKEYTKNNPSQKFCSVECREANKPELYRKHRKLKEQKKECVFCKNKFVTVYNKQKYCSTTCRNNAYLKSKGTTFKTADKEISKRNCKNCDAIFQPMTTHQVYCNSNCSKDFYSKLNKKDKKEKKITCLNCNRTFSSEFLRKYCNDECSKAFYRKMRRKNIPESSLKTIIENKVIRILEKAKTTKPLECFGVVISEFNLDSFSEKIKTDVKNRDKHCCQICEAKNERLEVHHILKRKLGGSNELDNLITLCVKCHRAIETDDKEHALKVCYKNARKVMGQSIGEKLTSAEKINILTSCLESVFENISDDKGIDEKELLLKIDNVLSLAQ